MVDGFDYSNYLEYVKKLGKTEIEFKIFLKEFLLDQAKRVVRDAKLRTPVDTGALRASWAIGGQEIALAYSQDENGKDKFDIDPENSQIADITMVGDNLEVIIWNPMEYASYVEYGHHSYSGRYMLTIAVDTVEKAMSGRFDREFKKFIKDMGVI